MDGFSANVEAMPRVDYQHEPPQQYPAHFEVMDGPVLQHDLLNRKDEQFSIFNRLGQD